MDRPSHVRAPGIIVLPPGTCPPGARATCRLLHAPGAPPLPPVRWTFGRPARRHGAHAALPTPAPPPPAPARAAPPPCAHYALRIVGDDVGGRPSRRPTGDRACRPRPGGGPACAHGRGGSPFQRRRRAAPRHRLFVGGGGDGLPSSSGVVDGRRGWRQDRGGDRTLLHPTRALPHRLPHTHTPPRAPPAAALAPGGGPRDDRRTMYAAGRPTADAYLRRYALPAAIDLPAWRDLRLVAFGRLVRRRQNVDGAVRAPAAAPACLPPWPLPGRGGGRVEFTPPRTPRTHLRSSSVAVLTWTFARCRARSIRTTTRACRWPGVAAPGCRRAVADVSCALPPYRSRCCCPALP